jgi:hypothetical protein
MGALVFSAENSDTSYFPWGPGFWPVDLSRTLEAMDKPSLPKQGSSYETQSWAKFRNFHIAPSPDFLWNLVALANFMRLSLLKGAHVALFSAAWPEIRVRGWICKAWFSRRL